MTLLLQGWEDCLEKGTRDVMSLENGPPCVHWRLKREREKFKKKKEERSDVKSDYGRGVVLFTISRMQKLRDLRDSEREKVRQATYKIASCEIKAEIIDQPLPPPFRPFLFLDESGGDIEQCALETHASSARRVHSCGRSKMRLSPLNHGRVTTGEKRKSTIFGLAFFLLRIVGNELRRNWNRSGIEW